MYNLPKESNKIIFLKECDGFEEHRHKKSVFLDIIQERIWWCVNTTARYVKTVTGDVQRHNFYFSIPFQITLFE